MCIDKELICGGKMNNIQKGFENIFNLLNAMNTVKPSIDPDKVIDLAIEIYTMQSKEEIKNKLISVFG